MKKAKIRVDLYNADIILLFGDIKYFNKYNPEDIPEEEAIYWGGCTSACDANYLIWVNSESFKGRELANYTSTLAHETLHTAWGILDTCGVEVNFDNHEALAYLQTQIFEKLFKKLEKWVN